MKIKRILVLNLIAFLSVVLTYGLAFAIRGNCVNCHTMHNSQNGLPMAIDATGDPQEQPIAQLLRADCIPCHTGPVVSGRINQFGAPIVFGTTDPLGQGGTLTLAGGDFWWVAQGAPGSDTQGHNVVGIALADTTITFPNGTTPPGWDSTAPLPTPGALGDGTIHNGAVTWTNQLTCAGLYGCHGNHADADQMAGIRGAHHGNVPGAGGVGTTTQAINPNAIGGSYRFLGGINGLEHVDWNYGETSASHNEYYGVDGNTAYANKRTISYACAQCHGNFHSDIGTAATVWLRHPTDIVLPAVGEYGTYNPDAAGVYSVEAPVARGTVPATSSATVTEGDGGSTTGAVVMCISCHRAHGSPMADILRWDYTTMQAGVGITDTGCFTCHTQKNQNPEP